MGYILSHHMNLLMKAMFGNLKILELLRAAGFI
jgi:hypothetical protein